MSSYCALADIQALNPKRTYDASSTPTSTQITTLINQVAVEIDAILEAQGYTVPITSPANFVAALKAVNAYGASALAEMGMFPETTEVGSTPHWKALWETYQGWLKALRSGEIPITLSPAAVAAGVGGFYTDEADTEIYPDPVFRKKETDLEF